MAEDDDVLEGFEIFDGVLDEEVFPGFETFPGLPGFEGLSGVAPKSAPE